MVDGDKERRLEELRTERDEAMDRGDDERVEELDAEIAEVEGTHEVDAEPLKANAIGSGGINVSPNLDVDDLAGKIEETGDVNKVEQPERRFRTDKEGINPGIEGEAARRAREGTLDRAGPVDHDGDGVTGLNDPDDAFDVGRNQGGGDNPPQKPSTGN